MTHYTIHWGIGSSGPRCQNYENDVPVDIASIECIDCVKQLLVDHIDRTIQLQEELNYYKNS